MLNILMCFLIVAVVVVYKQTYVASLCVDKIHNLSFYLPEWHFNTIILIGLLMDVVL